MRDNELYTQILGIRSPVKVEEDSGFTALFESLVIDWLKEAPLAVVSRQQGLGWSAIDRSMQRIVASIHSGMLDSSSMIYRNYRW